VNANFIRNSVVLGLTLGGITFILIGMREDRMALEMASGLGCFFLAWVYAQLNPPRGRD
jgi:hypothetical protein